jgi:hypothetical protein
MFASIDRGRLSHEGLRAQDSEWNNKLEIEAKSSIFSGPNAITRLFTGRSSEERRTW